MRAVAVVVIAIIAVGGLPGCFLLVTSGIRREIPSGAQGAATGLLRSDEAVVAAWDGSLLQDGDLLVVLTDHRLLKKDAGNLSSLELGDVQNIVVDEDEGVVVVVTQTSRLRLPLRSSEERRAFAHLVQQEVQRRKKLDRNSEPPVISSEALDR